MMKDGKRSRTRIPNEAVVNKKVRTGCYVFQADFRSDLYDLK
jgi:hypothetical protein